MSPKITNRLLFIPVLRYVFNQDFTVTFNIFWTVKALSGLTLISSHD